MGSVVCDSVYYLKRKVCRRKTSFASAFHPCRSVKVRFTLLPGRRKRKTYSEIKYAINLRYARRLAHVYSLTYLLFIQYTSGYRLDLLVMGFSEADPLPAHVVDVAISANEDVSENHSGICGIRMIPAERTHGEDALIVTQVQLKDPSCTG